MCDTHYKDFLNYTVDTIKTMMQGERGAQYSSTGDCIRQLLRAEGIRGLYRGTLPRLSRVIPGQGVVFGSYNTISEFIESKIEG